jgi:hypothetical protein
VNEDDGRSEHARERERVSEGCKKKSEKESEMYSFVQK